MSREAASTASRSLSRFEQLRLGREVIQTEANALLAIADGLHDEFCKALSLMNDVAGDVIVTGMGKAGLIAQKIVATLASTGTRSHFLHPAEAFHGDLGRVSKRDVVLALSFSGETEEVTQLLPSLAEIGVQIVAITKQTDSTLGRSASVVLELGNMNEACSLGLAPSTSTTAMLALGDALALVLSRMQGFRAEDFARFHPGGSLGRKLAKVDDVMRPLSECRVASDSVCVRDVLLQGSRPGRRTGAIMLVDSACKLTGIFTDSDLARLLETRDNSAIDELITNVMTPHPTTVSSGAKVTEALAMLCGKKISEIPVVDDQNRPLGLIDITDIVGLIPTDSNTENSTPPLSPEPGSAQIIPYPNRSEGDSVNEN